MTNRTPLIHAPLGVLVAWVLVSLISLAGFGLVPAAAAPTRAAIRDKEQSLDDFIKYTLKMHHVVLSFDDQVASIAVNTTDEDAAVVEGKIGLLIILAGTAAPWTETIHFSLYSKGSPISYIQVPTRAVRDYVNDRISTSQYLKSWRFEGPSTSSKPQPPPPPGTPPKPQPPTPPPLPGAGPGGAHGRSARILEPSADAYVYAYRYRNWNRSNRGKYDQLRAGWHPQGGESRIYMKFDLPQMAPTRVQRAILHLYHMATAGNAGVRLGIYRVLGPWREGSDTYHSGRVERPAGPGEICWVQQPPSASQPVALVRPGMKRNHWVQVDITPLVRQWLNQVPNDGLVIKAAQGLSAGTAESVYAFASRERANPRHHPFLEIITTAGAGGSGAGPTPAGGSWPDLSGNWAMSCVQGRYQFSARIQQIGDRFSGTMVRTNGSEPQTTISGRVSRDGRVDFMRRYKSWSQHYQGRIVRVQGRRALAMRGRFNHNGGSYMEWHAQRQQPAAGGLAQTPARLVSGTYRVEHRLGGSLFRSTWKLRINRGHISGTSQWPCCPGPRTDAMVGTVSGDRVVVKRDCSGQGWNGRCEQTFSGRIKGDRIEGSASGTGLAGLNNHWVLFLK